jgi:SNF family Na+-dependent transporter
VHVKQAVIIIGIVFAVALAVVIGNRMSTDAMAVVVGVVCGVMASIPTSLLIIWALRRDQSAAQASLSQAALAHPYQYPPVVVVNPAAHQFAPGHGLPGLPPSTPYPADGSLLPAGQRVFRVMGDE